MFESTVAWVLNRYLGKYIQDLDTENLNVGIFSGEVRLTDLRLKPEALYELELPIEVKCGVVGHVSMSIPWSGLTSQPIVLNVEDVLVVAGPVLGDMFDAELEKRLIRAAKKKLLEDLEGAPILADGTSKGFIEQLATSVLNNLQIFIRNVHIRYEDTISCPESPLTCGVCLQSLSVETTNSKWKPAVSPPNASAVYQLLRAESFSCYWNACTPPNALVLSCVNWRQAMNQGLQTFSINGEDFDFIVKPVSAKAKLIVSRSTEARVPRLLLDVVIQDAATQLSRAQFISIGALQEAFQRMTRNREFREFHPGVNPHGNADKWWKYAFVSILEQRIRPYSWPRIKKHRDNYRQYSRTYKEALLRPNDTELKMDLQKLEDQLHIVDIVIAREHAKIQLHEEAPNQVSVEEHERTWFGLWQRGERELRMEVAGSKERGLWTRLNSQERQTLYEAIGYVEGQPRPDKPRQYIDHKLNFTLANLAISLLSHGHEIVVANLTQFLASVETRPAALAFKFSARAESFVLEGAGPENELMPLLSADTLNTANNSSNIFSLDFEKNPLSHEADFSLSIGLEPVEIVYNEHTLSELLGFFQSQAASRLAMESVEKVGEIGRAAVEHSLARRTTFYLSLDLKGPYIVFPELGSLQRGGNVLVLDTGRCVVTTELQSGNLSLEDATQTELEERLYDRLHAEFSGVQAIFCDCGEEWREARKQQDSELHLLPRLRATTVFSNSVRPDYKQLPKHKLNLAVASFKINLSDRRVTALLDFLDSVPLPAPNSVHCSVVDGFVPPLAPEEMVPLAPSSPELRHIRSVIVAAQLARQHAFSDTTDRGSIIRMATLDVDKSVMSSDHSDEETELWARTMDQPGFEDNVSSRNTITVLMRFTLGEVVVHMSRFEERSERPYLMLRLGKVCVDAALMEYGPALQLSLGSLQLVDKIHACNGGRYLELLTAETQPNCDVATLLYRKVRANCPDFKSHFHSVEQSLVFDLSNVSLLFHREAFVAINKFFQNLTHKVQSHDSVLGSILSTSVHTTEDSLASLRTTPLSWLLGGECDPPIPPGATKFSYSARLGEVRVKLCDTDLDFLELKISGMESDCVFKANERMVMRLFLTNLSIEDLSDMTLYTKLLYIEGDHVLDVKYVRHSPRLYSHAGIEGRGDDVKSDGSLRAHLGRLHVVLLCKLITDLQHFLDPFIRPSAAVAAARDAERALEAQVSALRHWPARLHLALDLHAPTLLLPHKPDSPNLIIVNLGDLSVENFFKEIGCNQGNCDVTPPVIDNILIRLENVQVSRAVMTLAGSLEAQEPILEPASIRLDVKRLVPMPTPQLRPGQEVKSEMTRSGPDPLLFQISGLMESIKINLGQRDLSTLLSVWADNFADGTFSVLCKTMATLRCTDVHPKPHSLSPLDSPMPGISGTEEVSVKRLQAFLCQGEHARQESSVRFSLDSLTLTLFSDMDEVLSSPVRDLEHGLCRLHLSEASLTVDTSTDHSMELRASLQSCRLEDIRSEPNVYIKKIFESHSGGNGSGHHAGISVSTPPILDLSLRQASSGDRVLDVIIERTRLNLSVPFLASLVRFLLDTLPGERPIDGGLVNHGYVGEMTCQPKICEGLKPASQRPPSSNDSTSGYFSSSTSCNDENSGLTISLQLRQPEVLLMSDPALGPALLVRAELMLDYSRHAPGRESLNVAVSQLQILSRQQGKGRHQPSFLVLHPCDIELSKHIKSVEEGVKINLCMSPVVANVSASVVHSLLSMADDVGSVLVTDESEKPSRLPTSFLELENLWSPRKIPPYVPLDICENHHPETYCPHFPTDCKPSETLSISIQKVQVVFELEELTKRIPVLSFKSAFSANMYDWSTQMRITAEFQLQSSYYNESLGVWEPFIEPCTEQENVYRPWEMLIKVFHAKAFPMSSRLSAPECDRGRIRFEKPADAVDGPIPVDGTCTPQPSTPKHRMEESETSADDEEDDNTCSGMMFIKRQNTETRSLCSETIADFREDSDSENEEGVLEKLAGSIGHLFSGDSSEGEDSESEVSSNDQSLDDLDDIEVKKQIIPDCVDSCLIEHKSSKPESAATYILMSARDKLEFSLTCTAIKVLYELLSAFNRDQSFLCKELTDSCITSFHRASEPELSLNNDLGPDSKVTLFGREQDNPDAKDIELMTATFETIESEPSSPASTAMVTENSLGDSDTEEFEGGFGKIKNVMISEQVTTPVLSFREDVISKLYRKVTEEKLSIEIDGFNKLHIIAPHHTVNKLHVLHPMKNNTRYHAVVSVCIYHGRRKIVIRSPLQIKNETSHALNLFYKKSVLDTIGEKQIGESPNPFEDSVRMTVIEPDEIFNVPLYIAYHCKIFIQPAYMEGCGVSEAGLWWQDLAADLQAPRDITCSNKDDKESTVFSVRALCNEGSPRARQARLVPNYVLRLLPPLVVHNQLPYAVQLCVPDSKLSCRIEAGCSANMYAMNLMKTHKIVVEVPSYLAIPWTGSFSLTPELEEKLVTMATEQDTEGGNKQLGLNVRVSRVDSCELHLHAPYWLVNKTGLPLQIRGSMSDMVYESQGDEPLLFSFRRRRRRAVRLRVYQSSWSSAFSLDAAGTCGLVVCRDRERGKRYRLLMSVSVSHLCPQLTRIVTFQPGFLITNESRKHLRFMEDNERADLWMDIAPGQTVPFWPETDSLRMFVKMRDSKLVSQHFPIAQRHVTVLRMDKGCGMTVKVAGGAETPFSIVFRNYTPGDAPVRVDNLCEELFIKVHQRNQGQVALLSPYQSLLYTWDDPCKEKTLLWNAYTSKSEGYIAEFWKDGYGHERVSCQAVKSNNNSTPPPAPSSSSSVSSRLSAGLRKLSRTSTDLAPSLSSDESEPEEINTKSLKKTRKERVVVYWVSYLEGHQRVLLFTKDERIAIQARSLIDAERSTFELCLSMAGIGVSLCTEDSGRCKEVAYASISDSAPTWEVLGARRWKQLPPELAAWAEDKWKQDNTKAQLKDFLHVDFDKMHMTKPFFGELRRKHAPGIWLQYRRSENQSYVHVKLHRLQVDNQLPDAIFTTVLHPVVPPQPKHKESTGPQACLEMVVMRRHLPHNQLLYKYVKLIAREFSIQLDRGFLLSTHEALNAWQSHEPSDMRIRTDIAFIHQPVTAAASKSLNEGPRVILEYLYLSPLKLRFSFSPRGVVHVCRPAGLSLTPPPASFSDDVLAFILNSLGATITEVKAVRLRLSQFEVHGGMVPGQQLWWRLGRHYVAQSAQQFHALVLGLDVLGNPYGLATDIGRGLGDFFYQPYQGLIRGPDELAEGLAVGAQSLLGHVVGGTAGSLSLIAASLGNTLSTLSFDEEYRKRRRYNVHSESDLPHSMLRAAHTFAMGVALGLSGLFTKPVTGAQLDGVEGFFKGIGKGVLGLMTKPTGGAVDCIAMACDAIKRACETGDGIVVRARLPRYMNPYFGVKPFSTYQATGQLLLSSLSRGHYADTDIYWAHASLCDDSKACALITLQHVFLLGKCRLWGGWDVEWAVRLDDVVAVPHLITNKLIFKVRQEQSAALLGTGDECFLQSEDTAVLEWLQSRVETAMIVNMEDKPCPASL